MSVAHKGPPPSILYDKNMFALFDSVGRIVCVEHTAARCRDAAKDHVPWQTSDAGHKASWQWALQHGWRVHRVNVHP